MILVYTPNPKEVSAYLELFRDALPGRQFVALDEQTDRTLIEYVITWGAPAGLFSGMSALRAVFALGAGVDKLLQHDDLDAAIPIYRLLDGGMAQQMVEYVRYGVLGYQRHMDVYRRQQQAGIWKKHAPRAASAVRVGVLGLGEMGRTVALALHADGYQVSGWSRQARELDGIRCHHGDDGLQDLLSACDVLACILPSTPQTQGLLGYAQLAALPAGSMLINAGRGDLVDEQALLTLLDNGHLRCAQLDVFAHEPLVPDHRLWSHPAVTLTPHIAAITLRQEAVSQIAANLERLLAGQEATGRVARARAY